MPDAGLPERGTYMVWVHSSWRDIYYCDVVFFDPQVGWGTADGACVLLYNPIAIQEPELITQLERKKHQPQTQKKGERKNFLRKIFNQLYKTSDNKDGE